MPKRFADTKLWEQSWFIDLSPEYKTVWNYLQLNSDYAGIWDIDIPQLKRKTGIPSFELLEFLRHINRDYDKLSGSEIVVNRAEVISKGSKLLLTGFISEQYEKERNGINQASGVIKGVLKRLHELGLYAYAIKEGYLRLAGKQVEEEVTLFSSNEVQSDKTETAISDSAIVNEDNSVSVITGAAIPEADSSAEQQQLPEPLRKGVEGVQDSGSGYSSLNNNIKMLFRMWGISGTAEMQKQTAILIRKYGASEVETGFREAMMQTRTTLAYVRGVCRKRYEKAASNKSAAEAEKKKKELNAIIAADRQSGKKLNLVEMVYGHS